MRKIQFADFELDLELFKLKRGDTPIVLGGRALDLLIYLIENRERVVESKELREKVWHAAALSPSSIPTCVRELRIALQDDANHPKLIETSRKRGYRFIGQVSGLWVDEERARKHLAVLPFVGRMPEIKQLNEQLAMTGKDSKCRMVLIRGEAGIGKTRLLTEFLTSGLGDTKSYIAASPESDGVPAFWPWTQILREALADDLSDNAALRKHSQVLSSVFPEIQQDADLFHSPSASLDRHLVLSQWARTIRSISPKKPVILAFEDIHRTDVDTLSLFSWICEELSSEPILIVATHRRSASSKLASEKLSNLASLSCCESIDLPPLEDFEISQMLDPLMEGRNDAGTVLRRRTSGNAFYVTHLIRHLGRNLLTQPLESIACALPPNAQDIVSNQLSDLPPPTRRALSVASILGLRFSIESLSEILSVSRRELLQNLDPARRGWLVFEEGPNYEFAHSLLRDALYQSISSDDRKELHLAFARSIRSRSGALARSAQIAEHLIAAHPLGDPLETWNFASTAGREAAARFAHLKAQSFFENALQIDESESVATPAERCGVLLELAQSQIYAGDRKKARASVSDASVLARRFDLLDLFAECALQLSPDFLSIEFGTSDVVLVRQLEEALSLLPEGRKSTRSRLLARISLALQWGEDSARSEELAKAALDLARESGDRVALSAALSARAETLHGPDRIEARISTLTELGNVQRATANIAQVLVQRTRLISALLELGDIARLEAENEICRQLAGETGLPQLLWYPESMDNMRRIMNGDTKPANSELSRRYVEIGAMGEDVNVVQGYAAQELFKMVERDELAQALSLAQPLSEAYPLVRSWTAGVAWIQFLSGSVEDAKRTLCHFDDRELEALFREAGAGVGIATYAEVISSVGTKNQTDALYRRLKPVSSRCAAAGYGVLYMGCYARYCGLLASSLGRIDDAVTYIKTAIEHEDELGALAWKGYAEIDLVEQLCKRGGRDEAVRIALQDATRTCKAVNTARLNRRLQTAVDLVAR